MMTLRLSALVFAFAATLAPALYAQAPSAVSKPAPGVSKAARRALLTIPVGFEAVADGMVAHTASRALKITAGGAVEFHAPGRQDQPAQDVVLQLRGARAKAEVTGSGVLAGKTNYFLGKDATQWRTGVQRYAEARVRSVYPGIDLVYYGNGEQLEHDYIVAPGADAAQISMAFTGGQATLDAASGALEVRSSSSSPELLRLQKPVAYQQTGATRTPVEAAYARNADGSYGFTLGRYDHAQPLTIDPVIAYGTYFGGSNLDAIVDVRLDGSGNIYLLLGTQSIDLPASGGFAGECAGTCGPANPNGNISTQADQDFYIAELDPTGSKLMFASYLGGSNNDDPVSLAVDGTGIYVYGGTNSPDFPMKNSAQPMIASDVAASGTPQSGVLVKLSTDGSQLLYSTYFGYGPGPTNNGGAFQNGLYPDQLALAGNGLLYITGYTGDPAGASFPSAKNSTYPSGSTFVAKFDTTQSGDNSLLYATAIGPAQSAQQSPVTVSNIAVDSKQNLWIYGQTSRPDFPASTPDAVQPACGYPQQCFTTFLLRLNPDGVQTYATFLGGTTNAGGGPGYDYPYDMVLDANDNVYLGGSTQNPDYPLVNQAHNYSDFSGGQGSHGFISVLSAGGQKLTYSTFVPNYVYSIAASAAPTDAGYVMDALVAYVTRDNSSSGTLPRVNALNTATPSGYNYDAYFGLYDVAKSGAASILIESYLGAGNDANFPNKIIFDDRGDLLLGGATISNSLPTYMPYQAACDKCAQGGNGYDDGYLIRIGMTQAVPNSLTFPATAVGSSSSLTVAFQNLYRSAPSLSSSSFSDGKDFSEASTCNSSLAPLSSCTVTFTFSPTTTGTLTSQYAPQDGAGNPPLTVNLTGVGVQPGTAKFSPSPADFSSQYPGSSQQQYIGVSNVGGMPLPLTNVTIVGPDAARFVLSGTCPTLAPNSRCANYSIKFTPVTGQFSYAATLTTNNGAMGSQTDSLTATITNAVQMTASPTSLTFPATAVGSTSAAQPVTLTASGTTSTFTYNYQLNGNAAGNYLVDSTACPTILAQGSSCVVQVSFQPTVGGNDSGSLYVYTSGAFSAGTPTITLTGTATQSVPVIVWNPSTNLIYTGNPFGTGVLDAMSAVPGSFSYMATDTSGNVTSIDATTVPSAGTYTLTALFTPSASGYTSASATIPFTVENQSVFVVGPQEVDAFDQTGSQFGMSTAAHGGIGAAIDALGNLWSLDTTGSMVSTFNDAARFAGSFSTGGTQPGKALAIDGLNRVLIANGDGTLSILNNTGTAVTTPIAAAAGIVSPSSLAVDASGSVWIADSAGNKMVEIIGVAGPVATPVVAAAAAGTTGTQP